MSLFPDNLSQAERSMAYQDRIDADAAWAYQQAINTACEAIRRTPLECVTHEFIEQVLCTLASRTNDASKVRRNLDPLVEHLEAVADEIAGMA